MIQALIFDFDGLILDTEVPVEHADLRLNFLADLPLEALLIRLSDAPPSPSI
jgi:beta-phosphoglucomutase-like phosphatase (HAD superfamily)